MIFNSLINIENIERHMFFYLTMVTRVTAKDSLTSPVIVYIIVHTSYILPPTIEPLQKIRTPHLCQSEGTTPKVISSLGAKWRNTKGGGKGGRVWGEWEGAGGGGGRGDGRTESL